MANVVTSFEATDFSQMQAQAPKPAPAVTAVAKLPEKPLAPKQSTGAALTIGALLLGALYLWRGK